MTFPEEHDRSEVLTSAAYRLFLLVHGERRRRLNEPQALREAADIMGAFLTRAAATSPRTR
jgi:hypothetical protein